jgi:nitrite reductase/ring-hydroxylating ferredoxin subunit
VEDGVVECPLHAARFEINGGKCLNDIGQRDLRCYPTKVEDGRVWVQVHPA